MSFVHKYSIAALAAIIALTAPVLATAPSSPLQTKPCIVEGTKTAAVCGTLRVYEDRAAKTGRTILIHFALVKAKHPSHRVIAFNPGGPGGSAIDDAAVFVENNTSWATLQNQYDILLVDNRGTGRSAVQQCDVAPPGHPELYFMQLWPDAVLKACRDRLAAHANLSLYSSSVAADDLDDVRAALGYEKLALFGGSYGTRFYLVYARQHPDRVESIVLDGVAPLHYYIIPLPTAGGAQMGMDNLIAACSADPVCAKRFPNFGADFAALARRFESGPVTVSLQSAISHRTQSLQLSKEVFAETIRHTLYTPIDAAYIPVIIDRAAHGNYAALASMVDQQAQTFANITPIGINLSVTCAEDIPFITESDVVQASANSFEGDVRVRAQQRACQIWNIKPVAPTFIEPVKTDLPILMISGSDDPAAPPQYARQALPLLPNARIMLVKGATHDSDYPPCVAAAMLAFFRAQSASKLDLDHCAATYHRAPFATLTYFESAAGENLSMTARFRKLVAEILASRIDRSQITPAASKEFSDANLKEMASQLAGLGTMQSFVYRSVSRSAKGTTYVYASHFPQGNAKITITLNATGKISALDLSPG